MTHPNQLQAAISSVIDAWAAQRGQLHSSFVRGIPRAEEAQRHPETWRAYLTACAERGARPSVSQFVGIVRQWENERGRVPVVTAELAQAQARHRLAVQAFQARERAAAGRALAASLDAAVRRAERRERERRRTPQFVRLMVA